MSIFKQNNTLGFKCELHRDTGNEQIMFNLCDYDTYTFDAIDDDTLYASYKEVKTAIMNNKIQYQSQTVVSQNLRNTLINTLNEYYRKDRQGNYIYNMLCVYYDLQPGKEYDTNYCEEIYNIIKQYHDSHDE